MDRGFRFGARIALAVYVGCFAIGAVNHGRDFVALGWRPYAFAPLALEAFWTSLLLLDIGVVILLLLGRRRLGLTLAAAVMLVDVAANTYATDALGYDLGSALQLQTLFLGFVLGSLPWLWPRAGVGQPLRNA